MCKVDSLGGMYQLDRFPRGVYIYDQPIIRVQQWRMEMKMDG